MAVVLLPFPYAGNGFTIENLNAGDVRDFGAATDGLVDAGLILVEAPASFAERFEGHKIAIEVGELTPDEVRAVENIAAAPAKKTYQKRR